jgi:outer membrane protein assembly factor BamB
MTARMISRRVWMAGLAGSLYKPAAAQDHVSMIEVEGEGRKYWPRWRGPSGQGLVEGAGYPDQWSERENIAWKVEIPGSGNSSPVIWRDRIFLTTAYEQGVWPLYRVRRSVLCLRRQDGKVLWETFAPEAEPEKVNRKNGFASGTPATDGERVYAYLGSSGLMAVDFEGRTAWRRSLGEITAYHGTSCSPLLYKDRVILYQDQRKPAQSFVAAFDKRTGETRWWTERAETVGWGSPVAIRAGNRDEIIVSSQYRVYAYDPDSGKELWSCAGNLVEVTPTPVAGHGLLYCSSGRAGPTLAIRPGGTGDVTASRIVWQTPKGSPFVPSPLLYGDHLYLVNDMTSVATCLDARSGAVLWQGRLGEARRESFSASPVGVDGKVFLTNDSGETFVLKAGNRFELLRVNQLGERTLASAAGVDRTWYFRTERRLVAIGRG